jgi:hypothetical protein
MAFTRIQGKNATNVTAGQSSSTLTWTGAVSSGSVVLAIVTCDTNGGTVTDITVSDNQGNTYTGFDALVDTGDTERTKAFILGNITNAPTNLIATFVGNTTNGSGITADEFSGALAVTDPRDGHTSNQQLPAPNTTDGVTSTTITTSVNGDLIWGGQENSGGGNGAVSHGTGFTDGTITASPTTEYLTQGAAGPQAATFTYTNSNNSQTFVVAVKPPASIGTTFVPRTKRLIPFFGSDW